jgi:hypothetical protein
MERLIQCDSVEGTWLLIERRSGWFQKLRLSLQPSGSTLSIRSAVLLQSGLSLTVLLVVKAIFSLVPSLVGPLWWRADELRSIPTLELVAIALEYSAGIELAYTLFTEGPDEAVEPVIMGLAAAMLLGFSKLGSIDLLAACGAIAFVIALAGLFLIRHYFVQPDNDDDEKPGNGPNSPAPVKN